MALYTVQPSQVVNPNDVNQFTNLLNGTTTGVQITNAGRIRAQLTGATSGAGGYVGQVAGAAPASGTFVAGDAVTDGTLGTVWVCTAGGTPGAWGMVPAQVSTQSLSGTAASVVFSSLPTFTRFKVFWRARCDNAVAGIQIYVRFNGDTANNYLWQVNQANNATSAGTSSGGAVSIIQVGTMGGASSTANYWSSGEFTVDGAQNTGSFKTVQGTGAGFTSATNSYAGVYSGQWLSTAAITSMTLFPAAGNFIANSIFSVYGWM